MHPKLNWENFDALYARRRKRRKRTAILVWSMVGFGLLIGAYFTADQFYKKDSTLPSPSIRLEENTIPQPLPTNPGLSSTEPKESIAKDPQETKATSTGQEDEMANPISSVADIVESPVHHQQNSTAVQRAENTKTPGSLVMEGRSKTETLYLNPLPLTPVSVIGHEGKIFRAWKPASPVNEEQIEPEVDFSAWSYSIHTSAILHHSTWFVEGQNQTYLPFVSPSVQWNVNRHLSPQLGLNTGVEWSAYRFQAQLVETYRGYIYKPGSIVRYVQRGNQFSPVYSDTVSGTITRRFHENGNVQVISIPLGVTYTFKPYRNLYLSGSVGGNLDYVYSTSRAWMSQGTVAPTTEVVGTHLLLPSAQGSIALKYPMGRWGISAELRGGWRWISNSQQVESPFMQVRTGLYYAW